MPQFCYHDLSASAYNFEVYNGELTAIVGETRLAFTRASDSTRDFNRGTGFPNNTLRDHIRSNAGTEAYSAGNNGTLHQSVRNGTRTVAFPDLRFLGHACMHSTQLPSGVVYAGEYHPGIMVANPNSSSYSRWVASEERFPCAHCAYGKAAQILAQTPPPGGVALPTVFSVGPAGMIESAFCAHLENGVLAWAMETAKVDFTQDGCNKCGFPGHKSSSCSYERNYDRIGIEIEGRYLNLSSVQEMADQDGLDYTTDGSIMRVGTLAEPQEFKTKPAPLAAALRQLAKFYPDEADASCGLHVHVSFHDKTSITQLCTPEFFEYFHKRWSDWGTEQGLVSSSQFFRRLNGHNHYCRKNTAETARDGINCGRYYQLNFGAWNEHTTLECRMLPMFRDASLSLKAVQHLIQIYEEWLSNDAKVCLFPTTPITVRDMRRELSDYTAPKIKIPCSFPVDTEFVKFTSVTHIELETIRPPADGMARICVTPAEADFMDSLMRRRRAS